jgi:negative regulator of flagellin synthesis FlgM
MEISNNGRAADLAKILLGVQDTQRTSIAKGASKDAGAQDSVQISEKAKELQRLHGLVEQPDVDRQARVERLQASVEAGTYAVDGKKVADAIMRNVLTDSILS